jgi:hypothetical protein
MVFGVAYRITGAEAERLDATEGVPRAYRRVSIDVETADGASLAAFTYLSSYRREGRKPSERYLELLLRGARHHGLPRPRQILAELERALDERERRFGSSPPTSTFPAGERSASRREAITTRRGPAQQTTSLSRSAGGGTTSGG